ncbi:MAG: STT3 domain-containing protein [Nanoarchaeota archaeon]
MEVSNVDDETINEDFIVLRKQKFLNFFKGRWWVLVVLVIAVILGAYIRSLPMADHGGRPGLWDITTNTWTLGPDLDPWLFFRNAKTIVEQGSLPERDYMRNVPLGFDNSIEVPLLAYMIAWTYKILKFIGVDKGIEFAGVVFPVIMFGLTIISFFLFVREIFVRKSEKSILKANIIAIISTFFMIVIPVFLSRTVAGIPEKESAAFFFIFLSFYLFLKSWKAEQLINSIILGSLAGVFTGMTGLVWGGVIYIFIPLGLAVLIAFILNKVSKKEFLAYFFWIFFSFLILMYFSGKRYDFNEMFTSLSSGLAFLVLLIIIVHYLIWNTKFNKFINRETKIPKTILSLIATIIILIVISLIFLGPSFITSKAKAVHQTIFKPVIGRWNITVAENKQPDFREWSQNFGPFVKNIPLIFWMFFIGSVVLFRKMLLRLKNKDTLILTSFYIFFLLGIIFSRYSTGSLFNGENFISKFFYYISILLFLGAFIYYYNRYYKLKDDSFEKIRFEYLLLFSLFILTLFTARGAIRLIMVLGPIAPIFVGFLIVDLSDKFFKYRKLSKILIGILLIIILISSVYSFSVFYQSVKAQSFGFVPSSYNIQWQKAMDWARKNTPENAVFSHWWDYGYWVQSIGNRATTVDGGNAIVYWNYLMGRHVLTGDNENDALEFLYNHDTTYLLIDSTDIGKYGAFSSIGSNKDFDRYSFIGTFLLDETKTQETKNQTLLVYAGGVGLDEDLVINQNGKDILLPANSAAVGAIVLPTQNSRYYQPYIIVVYQNQQFNVNLRYSYNLNNKELTDFKNGIEAAAFIFPRLDQTSEGTVQLNQMGTAFYLSPRLMRGFLSQVYLMNDPFNKFKNFKLVHAEPTLIIDNIRSRGTNLPDFVYFQGVQGPVKIWEVYYTGKEQIKQEYLDTDETKYLDWLL